MVWKITILKTANVEKIIIKKCDVLKFTTIIQPLNNNFRLINGSYILGLNSEEMKQDRFLTNNLYLIYFTRSYTSYKKFFSLILI